MPKGRLDWSGGTGQADGAFSEQLQKEELNNGIFYVCIKNYQVILTHINSPKKKGKTTNSEEKYTRVVTSQNNNTNYKIKKQRTTVDHNNRQRPWHTFHNHQGCANFVQRTYLIWQANVQRSQRTPCLTRPTMSDVQWWHLTGELNVWTVKEWLRTRLGDVPPM